MTTDSFFALAVTAVMTLFFGSVLAFAGYRFLAVLLPILGFVFGFVLGAQLVQALFGGGFLATATSWFIGLLFAVPFAVLSYLLYFMAVSLAAGALGFALGAGLLQAIGFDFGFFVWLVGLLVGLAFATAVLVLNIQKYVVIAATALLGSGVVVGTFLFLFGDLTAADLGQNPVRHVLQTSPFWSIVFLALAAVGALAQYRSTRGLEARTYNRLAGWSDSELIPATAATDPASETGGVPARELGGRASRPEGEGTGGPGRTGG
jgi:hypothetical protein